MINHYELMNIVHRLGLRAELNSWCNNPDAGKTVWEYYLMSPHDTWRGALILRRTPNGTRVFVEMDDERLEAELRRMAGLSEPEATPDDAAEHLARERARTEAGEAAEEWLREPAPEPFTPDQRAWIINRIDAAIARARLGSGEDSLSDQFWPEGGGEIDF
jgi:Arc/MetJ family transcription regulator